MQAEVDDLRQNMLKVPSAFCRHPFDPECPPSGCQTWVQVLKYTVSTQIIFTLPSIETLHASFAGTLDRVERVAAG